MHVPTRDAWFVGTRCLRVPYKKPFNFLILKNFHQNESLIKFVKVHQFLNCSYIKLLVSSKCKTCTLPVRQCMYAKERWPSRSSVSDCWFYVSPLYKGSTIYFLLQRIGNLQKSNQVKSKSETRTVMLKSLSKTRLSAEGDALWALVLRTIKLTMLLNFSTHKELINNWKLNNFQAH